MARPTKSPREAEVRQRLFERNFDDDDDDQPLPSSYQRYQNQSKRFPYQTPGKVPAIPSDPYNSNDGEDYPGLYSSFDNDFLSDPFSNDDNTIFN